MKKLLSIFIFYAFFIVFCGMFANLFAQQATSVSFNNSTFLSDTVIDLTSRFPGSCNSISCDGQVQLFADYSFARLVIEDENGIYHLLYEAYPLIATNNNVYFNDAGEESYALPDHCKAKNLHIYIKDAELSLANLFFSTKQRSSYRTAYENHIRERCETKAEIINQNLIASGAIWRAKVSEFSLSPFYIKAAIFGGKNYIPDGYEYYGSGFFTPFYSPEEEVNNETANGNTTIVREKSFDWRKAHGANDLNSPYWDEDPDYYWHWDKDSNTYISLRETGNGWMTSVKSQIHYSGGSPGFLFPNSPTCPNGCFIFAPVGMMEAITNIQNVSHLNFDLSEQWAMETGFTDPTYNCGTCMAEIFNYAYPIGTIENGQYYYATDTFLLYNKYHILDSVLIIGSDETTNDTIPDIYEINATDTIDDMIYHRDTFYLQTGSTLYKNKVYHDNLAHGGSSGKILDNIENYGIVNEEYFPWQDTVLFGDTLTTVTHQNSLFCRLSFSKYIKASNNADVKKLLLTVGPGAARPRSHHICALVGFGRFEIGDTINLAGGWGGNEYNKIITYNSPHLNKEYWIFKDHLGADFGEGGYVNILKQNVGESYFITSKITDKLANSELTSGTAYDKDGDGYCFWGNGEKPQDLDCPNDVQDCNDNDPLRLYYDEFYRCKLNCDLAAGMITDLPDTLKTNTTLTDAFILRNLVIDNNSTLELNGDIYMGDNVSITIEEGSMLKIKHAVVSRFCETNWKGIIVKGNKDPLMGNVGVGKLYLKNSIIEDADVAITGDVGAFIFATDVTFRFNTQDVNIQPKVFNENSMQVNHFSHIDFYNCEFLTYTPPENSYNAAHVFLACVKNIIFTNCSFRDERNLSFDEYNKAGIRSYKAGFMVLNTDSLRPNFKNLKYGIIANHSQYLPIRISRNEFKNCSRGIYLSASDNAEIINNKISINKDTAIEEKTYGIYLDACTKFEVENNYINSKKNNNNWNVGIVVKDCENSSDEIYRNFTLTNNGIQAIGKNKQLNEPASGVKLKCNDFKKNNFDVFVTPDIGITQYPDDNYNHDRNASNIGIAQYQGSLVNPAGNIFSDSIVNNNDNNDDPYGGDIIKIGSFGNYINIQNNTEFFYYFHHDTTGQSFKIRPDKYTEETVFLEMADFQYDYLTSCPDKHPLNIPITQGPDTLLNVNTLKSIIDYYNNKLEQLTDGGNTELTVAEVAMATDNNAWQTYLSLMEKSPYLSDTTLKKIAGKENGLSVPMVRDLLVANPQAAKNRAVKNILDQRIEQLPPYMMEQINAGITEISPKEYLEMKRAEKTDALHTEITRAIHALGNTPGDSIEHYLSLLESTPDKINLSNYYAQKQDYTKANRILNDIATENPDLRNYLQDYIDFNRLMQTCLQNNASLDALSADDIAEFETYTLSTPAIAAQARAILDLNGINNYEEPIYMPQPSVNLRKTKINGLPTSDIVLEIHPNPAKEFIYVHWKLPEINQANLTIYNSQGIVMFSTSIKQTEDTRLIPLKNFKSGVYLLSIQNNQFHKSLSFTVNQ